MKIIFEKKFRFDLLTILKNYFQLILRKLRKILFRFILQGLRKILFRFMSIFLKAPNSRFTIPIIVFQPGKVGSLTVFHSLVRAYNYIYLDTPIYHVHILNRFDESERNIKETRVNGEVNLAHIQEWRHLREQIDSNPDQAWNIINLVRDPMAIKVSSLFQALHNFMPDWEERYRNQRLSMSDLDKLFLYPVRLRFDGLDSWYDNQLKAIWGIDVFSIDFPKDKGYTIYRQPNINLLIIRLENLNDIAKEAFYEFLGLKNFTLHNRNVGDKKPYAKLYTEFKNRPMPEKAVENAYSTRYAKHFYSEQELEEFRKFWLKK